MHGAVDLAAQLLLRDRYHPTALQLQAAASAVLYHQQHTLHTLTPTPTLAHGGADANGGAWPVGPGLMLQPGTDTHAAGDIGALQGWPPAKRPCVRTALGGQEVDAPAVPAAVAASQRAGLSPHALPRPPHVVQLHLAELSLPRLLAELVKLLACCEASPPPAAAPAAGGVIGPAPPLPGPAPAHPPAAGSGGSGPRWRPEQLQACTLELHQEEEAAREASMDLDLDPGQGMPDLDPDPGPAGADCTMLAAAARGDVAGLGLVSPLPARTPDQPGATRHGNFGAAGGKPGPGEDEECMRVCVVLQLFAGPEGSEAASPVIRVQLSPLNKAPAAAAPGGEGGVQAGLNGQQQQQRQRRGSCNGEPEAREGSSAPPSPAGPVLKRHKGSSAAVAAGPAGVGVGGGGVRPLLRRGVGGGGGRDGPGVGRLAISSLGLEDSGSSHAVMLSMRSAFQQPRSGSGHTAAAAAVAAGQGCSTTTEVATAAVDVHATAAMAAGAASGAATASAVQAAAVVDMEVDLSGLGSGGPPCPAPLTRTPFSPAASFSQLLLDAGLSPQNSGLHELGYSLLASLLQPSALSAASPEVLQQLLLLGGHVWHWLQCPVALLRLAELHMDAALHDPRDSQEQVGSGAAAAAGGGGGRFALPPIGSGRHAGGLPGPSQHGRASNVEGPGESGSSGSSPGPSRESHLAVCERLLGAVMSLLILGRHAHGEWEAEGDEGRARGDRVASNCIPAGGDVAAATAAGSSSGAGQDPLGSSIGAGQDPLGTSSSTGPLELMARIHWTRGHLAEAREQVCVCVCVCVSVCLCLCVRTYACRGGGGVGGEGGGSRLSG